MLISSLYSLHFFKSGSLIERELAICLDQLTTGTYGHFHLYMWVLGVLNAGLLPA